jgi:hypothetical protein
MKRLVILFSIICLIAACKNKNSDSISSNESKTASNTDARQSVKDENTNWEQVPKKKYEQLLNAGLFSFKEEDGKYFVSLIREKCIWCGEYKNEKPPFIFLEKDTLTAPRILNGNQLCSFKCYNDFKNTYFKNHTDSIYQIMSIYKIHINTK